MAKILKVRYSVTLTKDPVTKGWSCKRDFDSLKAAGWDSYKIDMICYEFHGDESGVVSRNDGFEYAVGIVKDVDAAQFLAIDGVTEITSEEAEVFGTPLRPRQKVITDLNSVLNIVNKVCNETVLDQNDKDIMDPEKPAEGINYSLGFIDIMNQSISQRV